ncbi:MAG TPA: sigma factor-like helix-turn-helix DNA-binding protein [Candidatus Andersenbacteria bacterium]|nr:sigma factor-like helix-turn-helix DNA-binding protein [Candidatus Andersenbacteria bacterium]
MNSEITSQEQPTHHSGGQTVNFAELTDAALQALDARSRDIIVRRFGLGKEEKETLESIGKEYGITRERVRQIEANAKKELTTMRDLFGSIETLLTRVFQEHGGLLAEHHAVEIVNDATGANVSTHTLHFYLTIIPHFAPAQPNNLFETHWKHEESLHAQIETIVLVAMEILKEKNAPIALTDLTSEISRKLTGNVPDTHIRAALKASKHVSKTAFGDWGLIGWAETSPRGVGDKAFAVLRRNGKPAHFRDITKMINDAAFDQKKANPQTVHNELIKDGRFILVGRGLYGLKEWGYMAGTVADVLESILAKATAPMSKQELVEEVLKQRMVKKNTILLSLQNTDRFSKTEKDLYTLKK